MSNNFDPRIFSTLIKTPTTATQKSNGENGPLDTLFGAREIQLLIPEFDPGKNRDLYANEWIHDVESLARIHKWDHPRLLLYATMRLGGIAKVWYKYSLESITCWDDFKWELLSNFPRTVEAADIHAKLAAKKRRPKEAIEEFVHTTVKLAKRIQLEDEEIVEYLIRGINEPNHQIVLSSLGICSPSEFLQHMQDLEDDCVASPAKNFVSMSYQNQQKRTERDHFSNDRFLVDQRHQRSLQDTRYQDQGSSSSSCNRRPSPVHPALHQDRRSSPPAPFFRRLPSPGLYNSELFHQTSFDPRPSAPISYRPPPLEKPDTLKRTHSPEKNLNQTARKETPLPPTKKERRKKCFVCKLTDHLAKDCPDNPQQQSDHRQDPAAKETTPTTSAPNKVAEQKNTETRSKQPDDTMNIYAEMIRKQELLTKGKAWLGNLQERDKKCLRIWKILGGHLRNEKDGNEVKKLYQLVNGAVYHFRKEGLLYYVPVWLIHEVVLYCHNKIGHQGLVETLRHMETMFWVPNMRKIVKKHIEKCLTCKNSEGNGRAKQACRYTGVNAPFSALNIGFSGPYEITGRSNQYIFIMIDLYSQYVMLRPAVAPIAPVAVKALMEVAQNLTTPSSVVCNNVPPFTGQPFWQFCSMNGIQVKLLHDDRMTNEHKKTTEFFQYIEDNVKVMMMLRGNQDWDTKLDLVRRTSRENDPTPSTGKKQVKPVKPVKSPTAEDLILEYKPKCSMAEKLYNTLNKEQESKDGAEKIRELEEEPNGGEEAPAKLESYKVDELVLVRHNVPIITDSGIVYPICSNYRGPYTVKQELDYERYLVSDLTVSSLKSGDRFTRICPRKRMKKWITRSDLEKMKLSS